MDLAGLKIYDRFGPKRFYHFVFWTIAILSHMVDHIGIIREAGLGAYIGLVIERNGLLLAIVYLNFYLLIPRFFSRKKVLYWLFLLTSMAFFSVGHGLYRVWLFNAYHIGSYENEGRLTYWLFANFLNAGRFVLISVLLKFTVDWFDQQKELTQTKVDKLQAELRYLKSQINPHFLFNTLNNLYSLSLKQSPKTPDVILRLSAIMEYMLYDSNEEKVRLIKDVEHLENIIALEQIRSSEIKLNFETRGEIKEQRIAPLLLLPLLENLFKHGVNHAGDDIAKARLTIDDNTVLFETENKKGGAGRSGQRGTGLTNLQKRLNHQYAGKHTLQIIEEEQWFRASLKIQLV